MATNDEIIDAIAESIVQPKRARTDAGEVEMHDIDKQMAAAKFVMGARSQSGASASPFSSVRFARIQMPGACE